DMHCSGNFRRVRLPLIPRQRSAIRYGTTCQALNSGPPLKRVAQLAPRHLLEFIQLVRLEVHPRQEFFAGLRRACLRCSPERRAALRDGAMEQTFRSGHGHQRTDFATAAGLSEDRDIAWIAAKGSDVLLDPGEGRNDVLHSL